MPRGDARRVRRAPARRRVPLRPGAIVDESGTRARPRTTACIASPSASAAGSASAGRAAALRHRHRRRDRHGARRRRGGCGWRRAASWPTRRQLARRRRRGRALRQRQDPLALRAAAGAGRARRRRRVRGDRRRGAARRHAGAGGGALRRRRGCRRRLDRARSCRSRRRGRRRRDARRRRTRVAFATLGCKVNQYDTATIADGAARRGCEVVPFDARRPTSYVVNTCTVTDRADAESRQLARRARRLNPAARVIVTGCFAQTSPQRRRRCRRSTTSSASTACPTCCARCAAEIAPARGASWSTTCARRERSTRSAPRCSPARRAPSSRCRRAATSSARFCIVPMARGRSRSVAAAPRAGGAASGWRRAASARWC